MLPISNRYPIKVRIKQAAYNTVDGLLYDIHYTENGDPMATCWLTESKCWFVCLLGLVEPIFEDKKKVLNEDN